MSRLTPFELAFPRDIELRFVEIQSEAARTRKDPSDLAQFVTLRAAQHIISEVESPELLADNPAAAQEYHLLVYVGFQFWRAGKRVVDVGDSFLGKREPEPSCESLAIEVPGGACYLQLPERRLWAQLDPLAPHEPLDGLFVVRSSDDLQVTVVAILGLRRERRGFSQVSATVASEHLAMISRDVRAPLLAPVMEGGTDAGFRSVTSVGELILLAHLALAHAGR